MTYPALFTSFSFYFLSQLSFLKEKSILVSSTSSTGFNPIYSVEMQYATVKIDITVFQIQVSLFCPCFTWPISNTWCCWLLTPWNLLFLWLPCFHSLCFSSLIIQSQVPIEAPFPWLSLKIYYFLEFNSWLHLTFHGFTYHLYVNGSHVHISSPELPSEFWAIYTTGCQCSFHLDITDTSTSTYQNMNLSLPFFLLPSLCWSMSPPTIQLLSQWPWFKLTP